MQGRTNLCNSCLQRKLCGNSTLGPATIFGWTRCKTRFRAVHFQDHFPKCKSVRASPLTVRIIRAKPQNQSPLIHNCILPFLSAPARTATFSRTRTASPKLPAPAERGREATTRIGAAAARCQSPLGARPALPCTKPRCASLAAKRCALRWAKSRPADAGRDIRGGRGPKVSLGRQRSPQATLLRLAGRVAGRDSPTAPCE